MAYLLLVLFKPTFRSYFLLLTIATIIYPHIVSTSPVKAIVHRDVLPVCQSSYGNPIYSDCQEALEHIPHDQNPSPVFATPLWFVFRNPMDTDVFMNRPLKYGYRSCLIQLELLHNEDDHETWYNIAKEASRIISTCVHNSDSGGISSAGRGGNIKITVTGPVLCKSPKTGQEVPCPITPDVQVPKKLSRQCSSPGSYCNTGSPDTVEGSRCDFLSVKLPKLLFGALSSMISTTGTCVAS